MSTDIEFTGERFLPEISGQIAFEHLHRYYFAKGFVDGRRVLDVACGEGYGSWILSKSALEVVGVDIAPDAIAHAREKYIDQKIRFIEASAAELPFEDGVFDAVVSFETIEHHDLHREMMSEIKRVLKKDGLLIISSPNKQYYSVESGYSNPFHVKELFRDEFLALITSFFSNKLLLSQRVVHGSLMVVEDEKKGADFESMTLSEGAFGSARGLSKPLYDLLVATDSALPDIHSTIFEANVHGLEPARFFGVHLPDRVAKADATILELQQLVNERGLPEDAARKLFDTLFGRIDAFWAEEKATADVLAGSIKDLANDLINNKAKIDGLYKIKDDLHQIKDDLRTNLDRFSQVISEKDAQLEGHLQSLEVYRQKLEAADQALAAMRNSWSWRLTLPLRWLRSTWSRSS